MMIRWIYLRIKNMLKSPLWWASLLLMTGFCALMVYVGVRTREDIAVPLYCEDSLVGQAVCRRLCENPPEGFIFTREKDLARLKTEVEKGTCGCGVEFGEDLDGYAADPDPHGEITLWVNSGSLDGFVVQEIVYGALLHELGDEILTEYMDEIGLDREAAEAALQTDRELLKTESLSVYNVKTIDSAADRSVAEVTGWRLWEEKEPVYLGILEMFLLCALCQVELSRRSCAGLCAGLKGSVGFYCRLTGALIPALSACALTALAFGCQTGYCLAFAAVSVALGTILSEILRSGRRYLAAVIPVLLAFPFAYYLM